MCIEELILCVTRNCTLECEHCLRGDRQYINMNPLIIDKMFEDVKEIETLLITGGEPLIAIQSLEKISEIIKSGKVKINNIRIVTNGTVLSERILNILKDFNTYSNLYLMISSDIFHQIELNNKNLLELRNENYKILCETFNHIEEYGKERNKEIGIGLVSKGRASNLTDERLNQINQQSKGRYTIDKDNIYYIFRREAQLFNNIIKGDITVDVYGNIVPFGLSFDEEDKYTYENRFNILEMSFEKAVNIYSNGFYFPKIKQKILK